MSKRIAIPDCPEAQTWAALRDVFRSDPEMRRVFKDLRLWEDTPADGQDWPPEEAGKLPALRATPGVGSASWASEGQHWSGLGVVVELAVPGSDVMDLLNAWGVVRSALFPQDEARRAYVLDRLNAWNTRVDIEGQAFQPVVEEGDRMLIAAGRLLFKLIVNT